VARLSCLSFSAVAAAALVVMAAVAPTTFATSAQAQAPRSPTLAIPSTGREALQRVRGRLFYALEEVGLRLGAPVYLRVVKDQSRLEVFLQTDRGQYQRYRAYKLCGGRSDVLGPRSGATGVPEGFYAIEPAGLRANGAQYLGLDFGWPNALDRGLGWTQGTALLQGSCAPGGHVSLTDQDVEEVYTIVYAALVGGQPRVPLHAFPFAMNGLSALRLRRSAHTPFWQQLQPAWVAFERTKTPPHTGVSRRRYVVQAVPRDH
jgi:murein L,D-transpeptidase YafK